jgi:hypothetical protein
MIRKTILAAATSPPSAQPRSSRPKPPPAEVAKVAGEWAAAITAMAAMAIGEAGSAALC